MKLIAVEEHFSTPLQREIAAPGLFGNSYILGRSDYLGHNILEELADFGNTRLQHMDEAGIDMEVLSITTPGPQAYEPAEAIALARDANDRLHDAITRHPDRLAGFACLPTSAPQEAAAELERAVTKLKLKGAMIHGHTNGSYLDDKKYWDIFERAQALDVPIYLHPTFPHPDVTKVYFAGYEDIGRAAWGYAVETSCHFLRLVFGGVFDAFPRLRFILGHLGEGLPFAMHRLNDHALLAAQSLQLKKAPLDYLRENLIVTTSGNWFAPAFMCTLAAVGADNIMFAVDWPYENNTIGSDFLRDLPISDEDREKVAHGNAERILRL